MKKLLMIALLAGTFAAKADTGLDKDGMKVMPNPVDLGSNVKIEVTDEIIEIEVIDMTGKTIKVPVVNLGGGVVVIKTDFVAGGIYFIKIRTPKSNMVSKLVVN